MSEPVWVRLENLPPGSLFVTKNGIKAVKSEYHYSNAGQCKCILLASGEYAHFADGNDTLCRLTDAPVDMPTFTAINIGTTRAALNYMRLAVANTPSAAAIDDVLVKLDAYEKLQDTTP